jgi:adenine-specific DNA-methyltransferase
MSNEKELSDGESFCHADYGFRHFRCVPLPENMIDKIKNFDPDSMDGMAAEIGEDNMAAAIGEDAILQTWVIADGYTFSEIPEEKNFAGYHAHLLDGTLYIIAKGWGTEQTRELLNHPEKNEWRLRRICIFGYSLGMESLRELNINVPNFFRNVQIEMRY